MDTPTLPTAVAEYRMSNREELLEFAATLVGYNTQNPPGRTVDIVEWLQTSFDEFPLSVERFEVVLETVDRIATLPGRTDRTQTANGTDGYTTTEALVRNAINDRFLPVHSNHLTGAEG